MQNPLIYLASPFSHPDPAVREQRFEAACRAAADLIRQGKSIFSPIAHSYGICRYGVPLDRVRREKVCCSSRCKSCPGKGRPSRVAIPTDVEVTKRSELGKQKAALGRLQLGRP